VLSDQARAARERADATGDPGDEALSAALEATVAAEARGLIDQLREEPDTTGLPTPAQAGYVAEVRIPPGQGLN